MKTFSFKVQPNHIRKAREDGNKCPIDFALLDAYPMAREVCTGFSGVNIYLGEGERVMLETSGRARRFINAYDKTRQVEPESFRFKVV